MKKTSTLTLAALIGTALTLQAQTRPAQSPAQRWAQPAGRSLVSVPGMHHRTAAAAQLASAGLSQASLAPRVASNEPAASLTAPGFGFVTGPDGTQWTYTQSFETKQADYATYYTRSVITIYDSDNELAGQATVEVPEDYKVNAIELYGNVTSRFFDRDDASEEFMVSLHYVTPDYVGGYLTYVYDLEGNKKQEYNETGILFDASEGWNSYQRLIVPKSVKGEDGTALTQIDIYAPPSYGETEPKVEHTFQVPTDLTTYSYGSFINCYVLEGKPYYVLSYYEKPYVSGYDPDTYEMVVNPDNKYIVKTYDRNYKEVDSLAVPIVTPQGALYRFASFGLMSDKDLSDGYFSAPGERNYVITFADYTPSLDSELYDFVLYDSKGKQLKTICENGYENQWFELSPVKGQSDQMAFLQVADGAQQIQMVNLPSCEPATLLTSEVDGETITTTLDRAATPDGYQYVVKLATADTDDEGNTLARIAWVKPDATIDHLVKFNLGPNGEYFTPLLNSQTLSPYLFDTDDQLEYVYIAKKKRSDSDVIDNVLEIANADGSLMRSFVGDDTWAIRVPSVLQMTPTKTQLVIGYYNNSSDEYRLDYYDLPLTKFEAGGDGTADNPYLISTPGDLLQVNAAPSASYKLAANLDMSTYNGDWAPLSDFAGTFDGDGHAITNLSLTTANGRAALFGTTADKAVIKNLNFSAPTLTLDADTYYAGIVAGEALGTTLSNVHVYDATITTPEGVDAEPVVGGLAGSMSLYSQVTGSSFEGHINAPAASKVGGIVGETNTSSTVKASVAEGDFVAAKTLGGIVGTTSTGCDVSDCRADVALTAASEIGGIVGDNSSRGLVARSQAVGTITAEGEAPMWGGRALGGIVGVLASDWSEPAEGEKAPVVVNGCVSGVSISYPEPEEGEEADATIHRIVGQTIANEDYEPDETPRTDQGLQFNYALSGVQVNGQSVSGGSTTDVEGQTVDEANVTRTVLETMLGYAYGDTDDAPWKESKTLPILYFENVAHVLTLDHASLSMEPSQNASLVATVYGAGPQDIEVSSSDPEVVEATVGGVGGHTADIHLNCKATGTAVITVKAGDLTATCTVTAVATGVNDAAAVSGLAISYDGQTLSAPGATELQVYNAAGQLVATGSEGRVSVSNLVSGTYVATARTAAGVTVSAKIAVR